MDTVRFGIVGLGNMGSYHATYLNAGETAGAVLAAVCDHDPATLGRVGDKLDARVRRFSTYAEMIGSGEVDAVVIAVPHYDHAPMGIAALGHGLHVLCEKPAAVSVTAARQMNAAAAGRPDLQYGVMFNQRSDPRFQKMRELIAAGELGEVTRISWIITDWFRTWSYYASGGWRATWAGEGGGVLINQCPHNLDLLQWIPDLMPNRVTAVAGIGKTHPIEVEDEVSAILEYPNGAIGHFVTTTGEAPGTNRLEIVGERGKLIAEGAKLVFCRTRANVREVRETDPRSFATVEVWPIEVPIAAAPASQHKVIMQNFTDALTKGTPLLGPGAEGVKGLEIGNAMQMAGITRKPVELPLDGAAYDAFLKEMIETYGGKKQLQTKADVPADMAASFK